MNYIIKERNKTEEEGGFKNSKENKNEV